MAKSKKGNGRTVADITVKKYADGYTGPKTTDERELINAFALLQEAKALEEQAKELKEKAYSVLAPNYLTTGMAGLFLPTVGTVEVFAGANTRTDVGKMCEVLVAEYKVPVEAVSGAKAAATTTKQNDKLTVKFKPAPAKEGKAK